MIKVKMELIDKGFTQKIADKHANLQLFTTNFSPILSTKRIIPRMRWLELVYALPYLVLRREILNSFKKTKNVLTSSIKQIWNIFVHLEFPLSRYEYITTRLHRVSREIMKIQDPRSKIQVKHVSNILYPVSSSYVNLVKSRGFYFKSSSMELAQPVSYETSTTTRIETEKELAFANYQLPVVTPQPMVVSHKPSAVRYEDLATYILTSASDFIAPLFSYYPFNPTFFLSQKTVPIMQRGVSLNLQKSDTTLRHYGQLERETLQNGQRIISYFNFKTSSMELAQPVSHETSTTTRIETEKESAFTNYQLPVVTHQPPVVSYKPPAVSNKNLEAYILSSTSDFTIPLFSYYSFKPLLFLSQKTAPIKQREVSFNLQKSDATYPLYGQLERETLQNGQKMIFHSKSPLMELGQPLSHETSRIETEKESAFTNYQLPVVTHQPPVVSHKPPAVSNKNLETYILTSTSDITTPLFSYYSFKPTLFLSQKTAPVKEREVSFNLQKSDAVYLPYEHLERETLQNGQRIISYSKSSSMELAQPVSHETSTTTRIETEKESAFANYQLPVVTHQPPVVSHKPSDLNYEDQATYILRSASDITTPLFSYYSFKPVSLLSRKTVPVKQRGAALILQKSDAVYPPYEHLERETLQNGQRIISYSKSSSMELALPVSHETSTSRIEKEKESPVKNYQLPVVTHQPPVVSHMPSAVRYEDQATYIPTTTSDITTPLFSYFLSTLIHKPASVSNKSVKKTSFLSSAKEFMNNKQTRLNVSEVEKAPIYHSYPEIEHVTSTHTEIIKERVIEKEAESKPPQVTPQLPSIDANRLADQVYSFIERKMRIEKERRGL